VVHNQHWLQVWQEKAAEHIKQADRDWAVVDNLAAPEIVGPPCAASPPTTKVALRNGRHMLMVGGQFARDAAGNVIGTGDLQQQIEQVGKNVGACRTLKSSRPGNLPTASITASPARTARSASSSCACG
jgi:hypothetical protein